MAIKISLVSDVADAVKGPEKVADAFEKVQDALDDVVKDAKKTGEAIEDIGDGAKTAEDSSDDMRKKFRDDFDKIRKDSKTTGDGVGKGMKEGTDRATDGLDDLKGEAGDTAREVGASFDGSAESIAEGFQEVAANAFAGFGPAGAIAGLAAAAGIGIAIAKLTEYAEKVNEAKAAGAEWATEFNTGTMEERIDALRGSWEELGSTITDSKEWYELGQKNAVTAIEDIAAAARANVGDVEGFVEAFNTTDPEARLSALQDALDNVKTEISDLGPAWKSVLGGPEANQAFVDRKTTLTDLQGVIEDQISVQQNANEIEDAYAKSAEGSAAALAEKNDAIEESNSLLEENADANRNAFTAELDLQEQIASTTETVKDNDASLNDKKRSLADLADQIVGTASAEEDAKGTTEAYNAVLSEQRDAFTKAAEAAGYTESEASKLFDTLVGGPKKKEITVTDNGTSRTTQDRINSIEGGTVGVDVQVTQASINNVYNTIAGIRLPAIQVQAKLGQAAL